MRCDEVLRKLEDRWNPSYALEWDNVGLLAGRYEKEVEKIFVALDATEETIGQALKFGADLLITHHPLLFSPVKKITSGDFIGRRLLMMIQSDLCYYAMHTNFDVMGMGQLNEDCLGLQGTSVLEVTAKEAASEEGIGRVGRLDHEMTLEEFGRKVKKDFAIPDVRIYGDPTAKVLRAAISSGSGKSMVGAAKESGADVLVTGDIDYHTGIDAVARGLAVVDAGHYGTEYGFIPYMQEELKNIFPQMEVGRAKIKQPYQLI